MTDEQLVAGCLKGECLNGLSRGEVEPRLAWHLHAEDAQVMSTMSTEELMEMIQALPPGYRAVFNLFAIEGYAHKEISEQMGISENTSKSQFMKARAYLRKQLPKEAADIYGDGTEG